jgi:hypothetical protein
MRTVIVGTLYRGPAALAALAALRPGDVVRLVREPGNQADLNAIAVYSGTQHLGYVPRAAHAELRPLIREKSEIAAVLTHEAIIADGKTRFALKIEIHESDLLTEPR